MVDQEELRRERDDNIKGVPKKDKTMVPPEMCPGCRDKQFAICICCVNFPICESKEGKPRCWVGKQCAACGVRS